MSQRSEDFLNQVSYDTVVDDVFIAEFDKTGLRVEDVAKELEGHSDGDSWTDEGVQYVAELGPERVYFKIETEDEDGNEYEDLDLSSVQGMVLDSDHADGHLAFVIKSKFFFDFFKTMRAGITVGGIFHDIGVGDMMSDNGDYFSIDIFI